MRRTLLGMIVAAALSAGCSNLFKLPGSPSTPATPEAMTGAWTSLAPSTQTNTCTDFHWTISQLSGTTGSGSFTATCMGTMAIAGTASGTLTGTTVTWTATATGTSSGASCAIALNGSA